MCRREEVLRVGGFREELHYGEDLDLWIRLTAVGELRVVPEVLVRWYFQTSGLSATHPQGDVAFVLPMIRGHVDRLAGRLSSDERKRLLGVRHFDIGYGLYLGGQLRLAAPLFRESFARGWRRLASAIYAIDCSLGGWLIRFRNQRERAVTSSSVSPYSGGAGTSRSPSIR